MSTAKTKKTRKSFDERFEAAAAKALNSDASETKVSVTCRLDSDVYMELKSRAEKGEAGGKYQKLMNGILRDFLFDRPKNIETKQNQVAAVTFQALQMAFKNAGLQIMVKNRNKKVKTKSDTSENFHSFETNLKHKSSKKRA